MTASCRQTLFESENELFKSKKIYYYHVIQTLVEMKQINRETADYFIMRCIFLDKIKSKYTGDNLFYVDSLSRNVSLLIKKGITEEQLIKSSSFLSLPGIAEIITSDKLSFSELEKLSTSQIVRLSLLYADFFMAGYMKLSDLDDLSFEGGKGLFSLVKQKVF